MICSGPGGRWFKSTRPDHFSLFESISYLPDLHSACEVFCVPSAPFCNAFARDQSLLSEFMALRCEMHFTASLFAGELRYRIVLLGEKSSRYFGVCRGRSHFPEPRLWIVSGLPTTRELARLRSNEAWGGV